MRCIKFPEGGAIAGARPSSDPAPKRASRRSATLAGLLAGPALVVLSGCSLLPSAGPTAGELVDQAVEDSHTRFDVVDVNSKVVATLLAEPTESFARRFKQYGRPPDLRIGVGDALSVTIWEAAAGGLFSGTGSTQVATGSQSVTMPTQIVGRDGAISVPYAGRIPVVGRSPVEVQEIIEQRLAGKAIEPQAIVGVSRSATNTVTVSGEVVNGAKLQLSLNGDRLLDLIAEAGGAKAPVYQIFVRLSRDGVTATIPMETLVSVPAENIFARPGDVLTLIQVPQTFSVFGAAGQNTQLNFSSEKMTLIEALAKAGGLIDERANPAGVFLFRFEPPAVVGALDAPPLGTGPDGASPVVYRLDLSDAHSYFLAQRFPLENKDIIYIANAKLAEIKKFFELLSTLTGPVLTGIVIKNNSP
jgi:polysaccharide biosynthesis/export protein